MEGGGGGEGGGKVQNMGGQCGGGAHFLLAVQ